MCANMQRARMICGSEIMTIIVRMADYKSASIRKGQRVTKEFIQMKRKIRAERDPLMIELMVRNGISHLISRLQAGEWKKGAIIIGISTRSLARHHSHLISSVCSIVVDGCELLRHSSWQMRSKPTHL